MKKVTAVLMILAVLAFSANVLADGLSYQYGRWWSDDNNDGYLHSLDYRPLERNTTVTERSFPASVVRDVTAMCEQYRGTPVDKFGLTGKTGGSLRSVPGVDGPVVRALQADTTVYVCFSFCSASGDEWYYVTCADGLTGFLPARQIMLLSAG